MLLPLAAILIAYIAMGVFPFGDQATMIIDSYHQYVPFFSEFHDKICMERAFCIHGTEVLALILLRCGLIIWPVR